MEIKQIKQTLKISTVLQHYNLQPDKNQMLNCPFHEDKTPSLKIYEKTNTFHCFGCGATGDQIEFIQKMEENNASTSSAQAKHAAIMKAKNMIKNTAPIVQTHSRASQLPTAKSQEQKAIISKIFKSFKNGLQSPMSKKAHEYLKSRHLDYTILEAGYNSGQFHHRGKLSKEEMQQCETAGLLIKSQARSKSDFAYKTWAYHCIIFPLKNKQNEITGLYGRSIENSTKAKHYYLKNRSGLYPEYPKPETEILILTESIIDTATLLQKLPETELWLLSGVEVVEVGLPSKTAILACYGTNGLTEEHKTAIAELKNLKEIIFFFDGDKAGRTVAEKYAEELKIFNNQYSISNVHCPDGEDINSLLDGHEPEIFEHLINKRKTFSFLTEKLLIEESEISETPISTTSTPLSNQSSISGSNSNGEAGKENPRKSAQSVSSAFQFNTNNPDYITFTTGELQMSVLGGINMQQLDRLRVTLKVEAAGRLSQYSIRNNLDLYSSEQTDRFIRKAAEKSEIGTSILIASISELTDKLEAYRMKKIEAMKSKFPQQRILSPERQERAVNYLKQKELIRRTGKDIGKTGVVGEENNRLLMYLIFTSRLREQPLHIISLGSSGTGKTYLQEKTAELIPEAEKKEITILSENAFYYFKKTELKNKLVLIEDLNGASDVLYPLRELQSKRKITKTVPVKDGKGNLKTITLHVEGPICLAGTTTKERLYEDNANRSILIYLDTSKEQKERIMNYQRKLSAGKIDTKTEEEIKELFRDMQTVLCSVKVINPYAEMLKIPDYVFKPLRTNSHYLAFIETVTFYHQYQRQVKTNPETGENYILTEIEDIEIANELLKDVLLAKSDELTKVVRDFFEGIKYHVKSSGKESFFTKELREKMRLNPMTINRYIRDLENRSYIKRMGGNRKKGFEYEVSNWAEYNDLQKNMNILNEILDKIRQTP